MKEVKIGILGLGVVAQGFLEMLTSQKQRIEAQKGIKLIVSKVLVREGEEKTTIANKYGFELVTDVKKITEDDEISIVIELMGRVHPAKEFIKQALENKKHVVTANKDLLAQEGLELITIAKENQVGLYYEASVAGAIPILRTLATSYFADNIQQLTGIVNGTTNFMLTKMFEEAWTYEQALQAAQEAGFAESDPTNDVDGIDAAYKLIILARFAFGVNLTLEQLTIQGIRQIHPLDVSGAQQLGYTIKLLGSLIKKDHHLTACVQPTFVPDTHLISSVKNELNGIFLKSDGIGESFHYGPGAGALPTGTSVLADVLTIVDRQLDGSATARFNPYQQPVHLEKDPEKTNAYFISLSPQIERKISEVQAELQTTFSKTIAQVQEATNQVALYVVTEQVTEAQLAELLAQLTNYGEHHQPLQLMEV